MRNCIYSSGEVISFDQGPCAPYVVDEDGNEAQLIDAVDESTDVLVTTEAPSDLGTVFLGLLAVVMIGAAISKRR